MLNIIIPILVTVQTLDASWSKCEPSLRAGLALSFAEMDTAQLRLLISRGEVSLVYLQNQMDIVVGAFAVQFFNFPNYRVAHIVSIGGRGLLDASNAEEILAKVKQWLKEQGASKVQGYCQPSRERLWRKLGCSESYRVVRMDL